MIKKLTIVILIFIFSLNHCSKTKNSEFQELRLDKNRIAVKVNVTREKVIRLEGILKAFVFLDNTNVYIKKYPLNSKSKVIIKKFDVELNYLDEKTFDIGQGPGEINIGNEIIFNINNFYIVDSSSLKFNIFSIDFKFEKFIKFSNSMARIQFTKDGRYFLCNQSLHAGKPGFAWQIVLMSFPDLKAQNIFKFGPFFPRDQKKNKYIMGKLPEFYHFIKHDEIFFIDMAKYQIMKFDLEGNVLKNIKIKFAQKKVTRDLQKKWLERMMPERMRSRFLITDTIQPITKVVPLGKGFAAIKRKGYIEGDCEGLREADYFDYNLNYIGKIKFPCFGQIDVLMSNLNWITVCYREGYIFLLRVDQDENYFLEKWKIEE